MVRPKCKYCGKNATSSGRSSSGKRVWKNVCSSCHSKEWAKHKKDKCDICGFIPINICQLDVDHKDGNNENNNLNNLQTLCANCHRLKTFMNKDWQKNTLSLFG